MSTNKPISNLDNETELGSNDLFMVSERISDKVFLSKKYDYSSLSSEIVDVIEKTPEFHPSQTWIFSDGVGISPKTANSSSLSSCVVTCEQLSVAFSNLFNKLSSEIYSKTHIPSSVGEIIYSTKLKTETMVKKYYGEYTSWIQIPGRFILASGGQNLNISGIKGGEEVHALKITEIPRHQHEFVPEDNRKTLYASLTLEAEEGKEILVASSYGARLRDKFDIKLYGVTKEKHKPDAAVADKGEGIVYGERGAEVLIQPASNKSKSHNNMPPFYSVYIWRRTK